MFYVFHRDILSTMADNKDNKENIDDIISEIESLHEDLERFNTGIKKIEDAPKEKDAEAVDVQHGEFIENLKEISETIEKLPKKWKQ